MQRIIRGFTKMLTNCGVVFRNVNQPSDIIEKLVRTALGGCLLAMPLGNCRSNDDYNSGWKLCYRGRTEQLNVVSARRSRCGRRAW
jgi:hypothetical protein